MSILQTPPSQSSHLVAPRKRTSSFSFPNPTPTPDTRPLKAPRTAKAMGSLRRTESYVTLPTLQNSHSSSSSSQDSSSTTTVPYHRTLKFYKEQRERRKVMLRRSQEPITLRTRLEVTYTQPVRHVPQSKPTSSSRSSTTTFVSSTGTTLPSVPASLRTSSPLAPTRTVLPGRPVFPRSKPEPDLYRKAITTRMRCSTEGQNILRMGPRLAVSIMSATKELERIVASQTESEKDGGDVVMYDAAPVLSNSWVVVPREDWEMVECGA